MSIVALFIAAQTGNNPAVHQLMNDKQNLLFLYMDYYSAIKRDEILMHAITWLTLENIVK